jgi:peptidoglycan/xylan/chitin deacetylase (PgdA/CDA1 family)
MRIEKLIARKLLFPAIIATGFEKKIINRTKNDLLNLYYHGVVLKDSNFIFPRHILRNQFEAHLQYFVKNFQIISIEEAFDLARQNLPPDRKTITITFDDGYENNYLTALPLLEKYKIKAAFFISGKCIEDNNYMLWADVLAFCRFSEKSNTILINEIPFVKTGKYSLYSKELNSDAGTYLKCLSKDLREKIINDLTIRYHLNEEIPFSKEIWKLLDKKQIKDFSGSPYVTIGSHGHTHSNLDNLTPEEAVFEMRQSKTLIEGCIERKVDSLAFPDGAYNENVKKLAHDCGYKNLIAVDYRCPGDHSDLNIFSRHGLSCTTNKYSNFFTIAKSFVNKGLLISK